MSAVDDRLRVHRLHVWHESSAERSLIELSSIVQQSDSKSQLAVVLGVAGVLGECHNGANPSLLLATIMPSNFIVTILGLLDSTLECITLLHAIERSPGALNRVVSLSLHRLVLTDALLDAIFQFIATTPNLHSFYAFRKYVSGGLCLWWFR